MSTARAVQSLPVQAAISHFARHSHNTVVDAMLFSVEGTASEKNMRRLLTTRTESAFTVPLGTKTRMPGLRPAGRPRGMSSGWRTSFECVRGIAVVRMCHFARRYSSASRSDGGGGPSEACAAHIGRPPAGWRRHAHLGKGARSYFFFIAALLSVKRFVELPLASADRP